MDNEARVDSRDEVVGSLTEEIKRIQTRLAEIKGQITQTELVVNREQQRNADIATELRTLQDNIETVPRQDIRIKYDEALDARFRLTTMRGQLEKFQAIRESLEQQQTLLSKLLSSIQGVDVIVSGGGDTGNGGTGAANVIRLIQAQEEERHRLSLQIHDGPAQSLTNFILQAEICQRLFDRDPARAAEELNNLKTAASVTFQKVREFIFDLRPMMLTDLGVVPTIRTYVQAFKEKNDIEVDLDIMGEERRLESHREVLLFRGLQELMVQARDYANATKLDIKLDMAGSRIKAMVEDNGRQINPEAIFSGEEHQLDARGQGLVNLKDKFEMLRGSIVVYSDENGTSVRMELPASD